MPNVSGQTRRRKKEEHTRARVHTPRETREGFSIRQGKGQYSLSADYFVELPTHCRRPVFRGTIRAFARTRPELEVPIDASSSRDGQFGKS